MWIRSQDKKQLVNVNDLYIATRSIGYCISTGKGNDLASYLSEEKAIKVLDMIQEKIMYGNRLIKKDKYDLRIDAVFEMPKEDEVEV